MTNHDLYIIDIEKTIAQFNNISLNEYKSIIDNGIYVIYDESNISIQDLPEFHEIDIYPCRGSYTGLFSFYCENFLPLYSEKEYF